MIRGLEDVCSHEIERRASGSVIKSRHREVMFSAVSSCHQLRSIATADDVFLRIAEVDGIGRAKSCVQDLESNLRQTVTKSTIAALIDTECWSTVTSVNVSASFLGKRNFTRFDIEDAVGPIVGKVLQLPYFSRREGDTPPADAVTIRVSIQDDSAWIGARIGLTPMHRRAWKTSSVPGTTHPPVAAVMAQLADISADQLVLDPCCGAGTLVIEAAQQQPLAKYVGRDISPAAIQAATANGSHIVAADWLVADASTIAFDDSTVDRILINPAWEEQVALRGAAERIWSECYRVLKTTGKMVALVYGDELAATLLTDSRWRINQRLPISLFGKHPEIIVAEKS